MISTGEKEYYKGVGAIKYEGKESDNPLAFKYYDQSDRCWENRCANILNLQ